MPRIKIKWILLVFCGLLAIVILYDQMHSLGGDVTADKEKIPAGNLDTGGGGGGGLSGLRAFSRQKKAKKRFNVQAAKVNDGSISRRGIPWLYRGIKFRATRRETLGAFTILQPFSFPQPAFSKTASDILSLKWVAELQEYLRSIPGRKLSLVTSTIEHMEVLLNWLVAAYIKIKPPLENVLVLSLDSGLHSTLVNHNISSLYVDKKMVISKQRRVSTPFSQVHVVRMAVLRLLNHYGYDVTNYDCDAILLKNPQPLFDLYPHVDLIGAFGKGPHDLYQKLGVTLNTGVMVMRSTNKMEYFWEEMPYSLLHPITDDQNSINYCLDYLNITWINYVSTQRIESLADDILGSIKLPIKLPINSTTKSDLTVALLSSDKICRYRCNRERDHYYVWHALAIAENRTVTIKRKQAEVGGAWYMKANWRYLTAKNEKDPRYSGRTSWLSLISQ